MYWEESGSASALPVLYLHGGPGGGCSPAVRQIFDPSLYKLICYDQRGCGQSLPRGELANNDLESLLCDIELLRQSLGIERWLLCGSSWGAAIACEYAKRHPGIVEGVMLYGVFLGRKSDIERFLVGGRDFLPGAWNEFSNRGKSADVESILDTYWASLETPSNFGTAAALAWARYEIALSQYPSPQAGPIVISKAVAWTLARISVHYFLNNCFLPDEGVLPGLEALGGLPLRIVHGSHDAVCDIEAANTLARRWPNARLAVVNQGGHVPLTPEYWAALSGAINDLRETS